MNGIPEIVYLHPCGKRFLVLESDGQFLVRMAIQAGLFLGGEVGFSRIGAEREERKYDGQEQQGEIPCSIYFYHGFILINKDCSEYAICMSIPRPGRPAPPFPPPAGKVRLAGPPAEGHRIRRDIDSTCKRFSSGCPDSHGKADKRQEQPSHHDPPFPYRFYTAAHSYLEYRINDAGERHNWKKLLFIAGIFLIAGGATGGRP